MSNDRPLPPNLAVRAHAEYIRFAIETAAEKSGGNLINYSGRRMGGERCVGVAVSNPVRFAGIVGVVSAWNNDLEVTNAAIDGMVWDQYGDGYVVYWPDTDPTGISAG